MGLADFWFCLIAVLWSGYFLLEGFDFGVGMLLPFLPRDEREREVMLDAIGPVWDGNEVWLVVAAGATFAAFPTWYATLFSGLYVALLLVLCCLIVRAISFEWLSKGRGPRWRATWRWANTLGSVGASFLWGVALANLLHGLPLAANGDYAGGFADLFSAYTVVAGLVMVLFFAFHGATFLTLRTVGGLCARAGRVARRLAVAAAAGSVFLVWTVVVATDRNEKSAFPPALPAALGIAALLLAAAFTYRRRSGRAFVMTGLATILTVATLFTSLYPRVLVSSPNFDRSLTIANASSSHYALAVMTVAALILTPVVLVYQAWTYYVLRRRLGAGEAAQAGDEDGEPTLRSIPATGAKPAR
jgi:cytochrome bd ubiquinol oxidase subunit II